MSIDIRGFSSFYVTDEICFADFEIYLRYVDDTRFSVKKNTTVYFDNDDGREFSVVEYVIVLHKNGMITRRFKRFGNLMRYLRKVYCFD